MNNELSIDELDQVAGGNAISTVVNTAASAVASTAKLVEGLAAAYLSGVAEYGHHVA
jgi:hypothetical protein